MRGRSHARIVALLLWLLAVFHTSNALVLKKTELNDCWTFRTPPLFDYTQLTFCAEIQPTMKPPCLNLPSSVLVSVDLEGLSSPMETTLADFDYTKTRQICVSCSEDPGNCGDAIMNAKLASMTISSINYIARAEIGLATATLIDNSNCFYAEASVVKLVTDGECPYVELVLARSSSMCSHWNNDDADGTVSVSSVTVTLLSRDDSQLSYVLETDFGRATDDHCSQPDTYEFDDIKNRLTVSFYDIPDELDLLAYMNLQYPYAIIDMKAVAKVQEGGGMGPGLLQEGGTMDIELQAEMAYIVSQHFWDCYHNAKAVIHADRITLYVAKGSSDLSACGVPPAVSDFTHTLTMWPGELSPVELSLTLSEWETDPSLHASDIFSLTSAMQAITGASGAVYKLEFSCYTNTGRTTTMERAAATTACLETMTGLQKSGDLSSVSLQLNTLGSTIGSSISSERAVSVATLKELDCFIGGQATIISSGVCFSPSMVDSEDCAVRQSGTVVLRITELDAKSRVYDSAVHGYFQGWVELDNSEAQLRYSQLETLGPDAPRYCLRCSAYQGGNCKAMLHRAFSGDYRLSFRFVDADYTPTIGAAENGEDLSTGWIYLSRIYNSDYTTSLGVGIGLCAAVVVISLICGGVLMLQVRKQKKILRDLKRRERRGERKARRAAQAAQEAQEAQSEARLGELRERRALGAGLEQEL